MYVTKQPNINIKYQYEPLEIVKLKYAKSAYLKTNTWPQMALNDNI